MKNILQTKPTIGAANPYRLDELIRTADKGLYLEVEIPVPTINRIGPPTSYLFLYLLRRGNQSYALAFPGEGIHETIETMRKHKEYEMAFRSKWLLLNSLLVDDQKMMTEVTKRPVMLIAQDPDDRLGKWVVGKQVTIPANTSQAKIMDLEQQALESLIGPTVRLQDEVQDAYVRVGIAMIHKEFDFPKTGYEKFIAKYEKAEPVISFVLDFVKDSLKGR